MHAEHHCCRSCCAVLWCTLLSSIVSDMACEYRGQPSRLVSCRVQAVNCCLLCWMPWCLIRQHTWQRLAPAQQPASSCILLPSAHSETHSLSHHRRVTPYLLTPVGRRHLAALGRTLGQNARLCLQMLRYSMQRLVSSKKTGHVTPSVHMSHHMTGLFPATALVALRS